MKNIILFCLVFSSLNFANAATLTKITMPAKVVILNLEEDSAAENVQSKTVTIRLKQTITRKDCNERTLEGKFFKAENDPVLTFAQFDLMTEENNCPIKEAVTETIYSASTQIVILPYVAGGNKVVTPADTELEVSQ